MSNSTLPTPTPPPAAKKANQKQVPPSSMPKAKAGGAPAKGAGVSAPKPPTQTKPQAPVPTAVGRSIPMSFVKNANQAPPPSPPGTQGKQLARAPGQGKVAAPGKSGAQTVPVGLSREFPGGTAPPSPPPAQTQPAGGAQSVLSKPQMAKVKSLNKMLLFGGIAVVVVIIVGVLLSGVLGGGKSQPVSPSRPAQQAGGTQTGGTEGAGTQTTGKEVALVYWGLWEPTEAMAEVISDFEKANPGTTIEYRKQSHKDYRERLQIAVASGNGPDLFRFHASWVPMLSEELSPMPSKVMSDKEYQNTFYPVAHDLLQSDGQIVGIPLMYDGLALYYNKEILDTAGVEPPTTWAELKVTANELTVMNERLVQLSGFALGNASNTQHFSDILGLLILQNGGDPSKASTTQVEDAFTFYTNFVKVDEIWSDDLPDSTLAFARGEAAMVFGLSWRAHEIAAANPDLDFGIAPLPKLGDDKLAWASFWAEGVSSKNKNQDESWAFLKYLSSKEVMKKLYSAQKNIPGRLFGEIYSRVDLADELADDEYVAPFLEDAPVAESWYLSSYTHDNGINDDLIKYYEDAVTAIVTGKDVEESLEAVDSGTKQVLRQYGAGK